VDQVLTAGQAAPPLLIACSDASPMWQLVGFHGPSARATAQHSACARV
jgi:hypothetical protein